MRWNDDPVSLASRFRTVADGTPEREAIQRPESSLSYSDLSGAAGRVARRIDQAGVGSEAPVGILAGDASLALAAFLGVLATGRPAVFLNDEWPISLQAEVLSRLGAELLLADERSRVAASQIKASGLRTVLIDPLADSGAGPLPVREISTDATAVVLFTSGSTGRPKGVIQSHRNLLHAIAEQTQALRISERDRLPLLFPLSGTAGQMASLRALLNGAALVPFDRYEHGLEEVPDWIARERLTMLHATPPMFRRFAAIAKSADPFSTVERVYLSGEPLTRSDVERFDALFPPRCVLVNNLGSTEASSIRRLFIPHGTRFESERIPVGQATEGKEVVLLDESGAEVPAGEVGEICVVSAFLSPGYWGDEALTAERFSADPAGAGRRRYRTGDLGRLLPDGSLECLGRKDHQVKVRGYRVETEGVDAVLCSLSTIDDAVVVPRPLPSGDLSLVAYVVPADGTTPSIPELRRELGARLPDYMVPARLVILDALPRLPGGKVNRAALPPSEATRPELDTPLLAPETPLEKRLAGIWASVLGVTPVGVLDRFQELGGDSLAALQLVSLVETETGRRLHVEQGATVGTIREMAAALGDDAPSEAGDEAVASWRRHLHRMAAAAMGGGWEPLVPSTAIALANAAGSRPPLCWCFNGFGELDALARALGPDRPLYGMYSGSGVAPGSERFVRRLGRHYAETLVALLPSGPLLVGGNCRGGRVAWEVQDQLRALGRVVDGICLLEFFDPRLYRDSVRATLLYGRESHLSLHESFAWGEEGWQRAFERIPSVHLIPGAHGEFFLPDNVTHLARRVEAFLAGGEPVGAAPGHRSQTPMRGER